jgi:hypothetical protein
MTMPVAMAVILRFGRLVDDRGLGGTGCKPLIRANATESLRWVESEDLHSG